MGVLSNKIDREQLNPGDHIYSWRQAYIYAHHGIYVGEGMVIHFTRGAGQEIGTGTMLDRLIFSSTPSHATDIPCPKCGDQTRSDGVMYSCLDCFLSGGDLYLFEYGVSSAFFLAKARGGTCTLATSDSTEDVLHRALLLLENGFGSYHVFKNNCEDFAIYCKTGLLVNTNISVGRSGQAASYFTAAASAIGVGKSGQASSYFAAASAIASPPRFMTTGFGGVSLVGCAMYCVSRLVFDIGVRPDVTKVPVEKLIAKILQHPIASASTSVSDHTAEEIIAEGPELNNEIPSKPAVVATIEPTSTEQSAEVCASKQDAESAKTTSQSLALVVVHPPAQAQDTVSDTAESSRQLSLPPNLEDMIGKIVDEKVGKIVEEKTEQMAQQLEERVQKQIQDSLAPTNAVVNQILALLMDFQKSQNLNPNQPPPPPPPST